MRHKQYFRLDTKSNLVEVLNFKPEDFKALGIPVTPVYGMHKLNALELLNKWNAVTTGQYVYFID